MFSKDINTELFVNICPSVKNEYETTLVLSFIINNYNVNKDGNSLIMMSKIEGNHSCILLLPDEQVFEKVYSNIVI